MSKISNHLEVLSQELKFRGILGYAFRHLLHGQHIFKATNRRVTDKRGNSSTQRFRLLGQNIFLLVKSNHSELKEGDEYGEQKSYILTLIEGDNVGRVLVIEFTERDDSVFDEIMRTLKQYPAFERMH